jgi:hypothetical protein
MFSFLFFNDDFCDQELNLFGFDFKLVTIVEVFNFIARVIALANIHKDLQNFYKDFEKAYKEDIH